MLEENKVVKKKSVWKAIGIWLLAYICLSLPTTIIGAIMGSSSLMDVGLSVGILLGCVVSCFYYKKLEYTVIASTIVALMIVGNIIS